MSGSSEDVNIDPTEGNVAWTDDGRIIDEDVRSPAEDLDDSPNQEELGDAADPTNSGDLDEFPHGTPPEERPAHNYNSRRTEGLIGKMLNETIEERPQVFAYAGSIVLMMVSLYLSSPLFAVLGGGLLVLTALHNAD